MTKPDDSGLAPDALRAVEDRARNLLDRSAAWNRFPTPIEDILQAARLQVAPTRSHLALLTSLRKGSDASDDTD
jgi:hypothetical protein